MAQTVKSGASRAPRITGAHAPIDEIQRKYASEQERQREHYANADGALRTLRDLSRSTTRTITAYDKDTIKGYLTGNIASNEDNLRAASRYLFYRSQIYMRLCYFYANMFCLDCRKVTPNFDLTKDMDAAKVLKQYNQTLNFLDIMNMQNNMNEMLLNCFIEDAVYALFFHDDTGSFFYILDPSTCKIESRYMTGDFGFSIDMSQWRSAQKQQQIEYLGEPLQSMYREYERDTRTKYVRVPDEYAACFKFRTDIWDTVIPVFLPMMMQLANLNDLVDVQAIADEQQIYKLVYLPMKVLQGSKISDDWEISPDLMLKYFDRLVDEALPDYITAAPIPGDELGVIDFSNNVAADVDRVEQSQSQILATSGGGMILDANQIKTSAALKAALQAETEFAISSLLPQINGFTNRMLSYNVSNPCHVEYFPISVYTKEDTRKALLEANQHSYPYRLGLGTLLGYTEKETLAMLHFEEDVLGLHNIMRYPLMSSYTQSSSDGTGQVGQGRDPVDDTELSPSGERSRNK